jgi:hypothetical protein
MPQKSASKTHRPSRLEWRKRFNVPWVVEAVAALTNTTFRVTFVDGATGIVDMTPMLRSKANKGVFEALRDPKEFRRVLIEHGAVAWPCGVDLAPDAMHEEIKKNGRWVLE